MARIAHSLRRIANRSATGSAPHVRIAQSTSPRRTIRRDRLVVEVQTCTRGVDASRLPSVTPCSSVSVSTCSSRRCYRAHGTPKSALVRAHDRIRCRRAEPSSSANRPAPGSTSTSLGSLEDAEGPTGQSVLLRPSDPRPPRSRRITRRPPCGSAPSRSSSLAHRLVFPCPASPVSTTGRTVGSLNDRRQMIKGDHLEARLHMGRIARRSSSAESG